MDTNKEKIQIDAEEYFEEKNEEAEELLKDPDKMEVFLQKLENKLKTIPIAGNSLAYVPMMISMVRMYMKKEYTDIPVASIISIVVALICVFNPFDLIPDALPGVGYIDDAIIVSACIGLIRTDLEDYKTWREKNGYVMEDLPEYEDITNESDKLNKLGKAFLSGKKWGSKRK